MDRWAASAAAVRAGATGNVVFEDLVFLCESKGSDGIDIESWSRCARY